MDALRTPGACAFCAMFNSLETKSVAFIMSPAYMEDDVRRETNRAGFCARHLSQMYEAQNRLGLALMLHTHLQKVIKDMDTLAKGRAASLFGKDSGGPAAKLGEHFAKVNKSCYVCERIAVTFDRYIDTFFHLWGKGGEAGGLIASQPGYCLPHFSQLCESAAKLGKSKRDKFTAEFVPRQISYLQTLANDLEWFTQKFDHRNAELPWGNSRDALVRAIALLSGYASAALAVKSEGKHG
jgi:hypothetical protein